MAVVILASPKIWGQSAKEKQPYAIGLGNKGPMAFAGLWEEWTPKDGTPPILSCTIITTGPNSLMELT